MASINYAAREISVKIVYYGPGLSGKTTNLQIIHKKVPPEFKSDMVSLATETDRTLFFDFLPLDLGKIKGFSTKFQLYTVPGQVYYNATRKLVLRGVDGVVFVADSSPDKVGENIESFQNLEENLAEYGYQRETVPIIIQYNKRDLPNALSIEELHNLINKYNLPWGEAVANKGKGVFDSLKQIGKIVIDTLNKKYSRPQRGASPSAPVQEQPRQVQQPAPVPQRQPVAPPIQQQRPSAPPQFQPPQQAQQPQRQQSSLPQRPVQPQPLRQAPPPQPRPQQQPLSKPQNVRSINQELKPTSDFDVFEATPTSEKSSPFVTKQTQPSAEKPAQEDYMNYGSIQLESMQSNAPQSRAPGQVPSTDMAFATPETASKTDLDLEIEKYQREIEEKQRRMRSSQPSSVQQPPVARQQFVQPVEEQPLAYQQPAPLAQPQFAPQQQDQNDYDVYNVEASTSYSPPEEREQRPPSPQRPQQGAISDDSDAMFFTSVDTDRQKKPVKRPVNPRNKPQKGFLSKLFNRETP